MSKADDALLRHFVADRDSAFIKAVMDDDWKAFRMYAFKWGIEVPGNDRIMKAGVYKAVQECTIIPDSVKQVASEKCVALGFRPTMS